MRGLWADERFGDPGTRRIAAGGLAALAGVALLVVALLPEPPPPPPDPASVARAASSADVERLARVWHSVPVERLFPAELRIAGDDPPMAFTRLGIAPEAECASVLDPALLTTVGIPCRRVLRATYVDATRTMVATAGIVVLDRPPSGEPRVPGTRNGDVLVMRAYGVRATDAGRFGDKQRISSGTAVLTGEPEAPYLLTVVVGSADGRAPSRLPGGFDKRTHREIDRAEWRLFGDNVLIGLKSALYAAIQAGRPGAAG